MNRYLLSLLACVVLVAAVTGAFAQSSSMGASNRMESGHMGSGMKTDMRRSIKTGGNVGVLAPSLQGKPVVAQIHADWCPVCKAERSTIEALRVKYGNKISFVELDVTNAKTANAAAAKAERLGLGGFFDAHKAMTGTVAVINPRSGAVAATLYNVTTQAPYVKAINAVSTKLRS